MRIVIPGDPVPWGRSRLGRGQHFTPERVRTWQGVARTAAADAMGEHPPMSGPVLLQVSFEMHIHAGWPQWKRDAALSGDIRPATKPDLDNLLKNVEDAFNKIVFSDDVQVVEVFARKEYSETPRTVVNVRELPAISSSGARKKDLPQ